MNHTVLTTCRNLSLRKANRLLKLHGKALGPPWEFWDRPDNQLIMQKVGRKKWRYIAGLAGLDDRTNEFKLLVELRNHAGILLIIARQYLLEQRRYKVQTKKKKVNDSRRIRSDPA